MPFPFELTGLLCATLLAIGALLGSRTLVASGLLMAPAAGALVFAPAEVILSSWQILLHSAATGVMLAALGLLVWQRMAARRKGAAPARAGAGPRQ